MGRKVIRIIRSWVQVPDKPSIITLLPENDDYLRIEVQEGQELEIWGVATFVIHAL